MLNDLIISKTPNTFNESMMKFLVYFRNSYIKYVNKTGDDVRESFFSTQLWNVHQNVIIDLPRTNNAIERWHRCFKKRFPNANMRLSSFILRLKDEEEQTHQKILHLNMNSGSPIHNRERCKNVYFNVTSFK